MLAIPPFGRAGNSPYRANSKPPVELGGGDLTYSFIPVKRFRKQCKSLLAG